MKKHRLSAAGIAARRKNAQKSTGPRTPLGKFRSSLNRLKYDPLSVKLTALMLFWGEDVREYRKMHRQLIALFLPRDLRQSMCVTELAEAWWEKVRALRGFPIQPFRHDRIREAEERIEAGLENLIDAMRAETRKGRYIIEVRLGAPFNSLAELRCLVEDQLEVVREAARQFYAPHGTDARSRSLI